MIALLQRVSQASVSVDGTQIAQIASGILVFVGVERDDSDAAARRLCERMLAYRVFPDAQGKMNLDVRSAAGGLLLVPQFTLAADTNSGNRPSFSTAAPPAEGERLFSLFVDETKRSSCPVATGRFGADMQVSLINEGPVTFRLRVPPDP